MNTILMRKINKSIVDYHINHINSPNTIRMNEKAFKSLAPSGLIEDKSYNKNQLFGLNVIFDDFYQDDNFIVSWENDGTS